MSQHDLVVAYPAEMEAFQALLEQVDKSNPQPADRKALMMFLREHPHLWRYVGDLMEQSMLRLIDNLDASTVARVGLRTAVEQLPHELTRPGDGPLEQLLIQQVTMCWLRLAHVEYHYSAVSTQPSATAAQLTYWDKRLNAAQRRYLRAIETLARVRKLTLPALQINIGEQQVNQVIGQPGRE